MEKKIADLNTVAIKDDNLSYPSPTTLGHDPEIGHYAKIRHKTTCKDGVVFYHEYKLELDVSIDVLRWHAAKNINIQGCRPKYFRKTKHTDIPEDLVLSAREMLTVERKSLTPEERAMNAVAKMTDEEKAEFLAKLMEEV